MLFQFCNFVSEKEVHEQLFSVEPRSFEVKFLNAISVRERIGIVTEYQAYFNLCSPTDLFENTFLHFIVEKGDLETITSVVSSLPEDALNCHNLLYDTPLSWAQSHKREKVVELLLAHGAKLDSTDDDGIQNLFRTDTSDSTKKIENPFYRLAHFRLEGVVDQAGFDQFIDDLNQQDLGLQTPIDKDGNTLLHLFAINGKQKVFKTLLTFVSPQVFDCQNDLGQTPYILAIANKRFTLASALLTHGINPIIPDYKGNLLLLCSSLEDLFSFIPKSIDDYIRANRLLDDTFYNCDFDGTISSLLNEGFTLEEPFDDNENTLLHWLVLNAPFHFIRKILYFYPQTNINVSNRRGSTPLMLAASTGRQLVVDLLISKGASLQQADFEALTAKEYAALFPKPIDFLPAKLFRYQTIYLNLISKVISQVIGKPRLEQHVLVAKLFDLYIAYIRQQGWHYEGVVDKSSDYNRLSRNSYFLDCEMGKNYNVNCFDIANGFMHFIKTFGIKGARLHVYDNIKSKPFTPKDPKIKGDFECFDKIAHAKILEQNNFYSFAKHCVIIVLGRVYDPTFCCSYTDVNDVVHTEEIVPVAPVAQETKREPVNRNSKEVSYLRQFKSYLGNTIFPLSEWDILQRKGKIIVSAKTTPQRLELLFENNLITFTEVEFISDDTLSKINEAWKNTLPKAINSLYDVFILKQKEGKACSPISQVALENNRYSLNRSLILS
ncbi:MAG: ankyrin repeat domain-containing protein [Gammaproteobacteria bacterium]|jgi:ankyrin repeat protein|nr:ankyrin repeat domain-containing protein [Gammaproteobacteria bacterium]